LGLLERKCGLNFPKREKERKNFEGEGLGNTGKVREEHLGKEYEEKEEWLLGEKVYMSGEGLQNAMR